MASEVDTAVAGFATTLLVLSLAACALESTPQPDEERVLVIDAHIHTDFTDQPEPVSGVFDSRDSLLAVFARAGVVGAVAHTDTLGKGWVDLVDHGVVHCGGVGGAPDLARLESGLADGRYRCLKLYPGYVYRYPTDSIYEPVYELAARFDVPVVIHTGDPYTSDGLLRFADPLHVDDVAVAHRDVRFVIAHAGYPWFQTAAEVAYKNPNVWIEASAFMVGDPAAVDPEWLERFVVEPIRWIFGYVEDPSKAAVRVGLAAGRYRGVCRSLPAGDPAPALAGRIPRQRRRGLRARNLAVVRLLQGSPSSSPPPGATGLLNLDDGSTTRLTQEGTFWTASFWETSDH